MRKLEEISADLDKLAGELKEIRNAKQERIDQMKNEPALDIDELNITQEYIDAALESMESARENLDAAK